MRPMSYSAKAYCLSESVLFSRLQMTGLEEKFDKEISDTCRIVASRFPLPNWQPVRVIGEGLDTVWVYMHPRNPDYEKMKLSINFKEESYNTFDSKELFKDEFSTKGILNTCKSLPEYVCCS